MKQAMAGGLLAALLLFPGASGAPPADEADTTWSIFQVKQDYLLVTGITPESDKDGHPRFPMTLVGVWDFEEFNLNPGQSVPIDDPCMAGVGNAVFPSGLALAGMRFQSNTFAHGLNVMPRGALGLVAVPPGGGVASKVLLSNVGVDGIDLIVTGTTAVYGVGFDVVTGVATPNVRVRVFDQSNTMIGEFTTNGSPSGSFFGLIRGPGPASPSIARVNLIALTPTGLPAMVREGADNVQVNVSAP